MQFSTPELIKFGSGAETSFAGVLLAHKMADVWCAAAIDVPVVERRLGPSEQSVCSLCWYDHTTGTDMSTCAGERGGGAHTLI